MYSNESDGIYRVHLCRACGLVWLADDLVTPCPYCGSFKAYGGRFAASEVGRALGYLRAIHRGMFGDHPKDGRPRPNAEGPRGPEFDRTLGELATLDRGTKAASPSGETERKLTDARSTTDDGPSDRTDRGDGRPLDADSSRSSELGEGLRQDRRCTLRAEAARFRWKACLEPIRDARNFEAHRQNWNASVALDRAATVCEGIRRREALHGEAAPDAEAVSRAVDLQLLGVPKPPNG